MISGIERVKSKRMWFVPDFLVWGRPGAGGIEYLALESIDGNASILFGQADIGGSSQEVPFNSLIDHRGNRLPSTLSCPRVLPRSRCGDPVFVIDAESPSSFTIGCDSDTGQPVRADLLIIELGD